MDQYKGSDVDKYRCFMSGEGEKNTTWKLGVPPNFDVVNKLFEEGRTKKPLTPKGVAKIGGGYNMFLQTSLSQNLRMYDYSEETVDTAHKLFTTTFPRGFAVEIL
ncbi:hypothetical protein HanRHA438_Chr02g0092621 [Helianthus annuus]|nr:hypothetical protein HanRHA438_Chr02g0092621 [Helianthus annuus]